MHQSSNLRGILCMVLAGAAFVANDTLLKTALYELPPLQTLVLRGSAALLWCLPLLLAMGHGKQLPQAFRGWVLVRSLCELVAIFAFIQALAHMSIADVTAIYQISPLLVILGAAWIWRIKIAPWQILLVCLGMAGALMIAQPGSSAASWYLVLPFITAIGASARDLASRNTPASVPGLIVAVSTIITVLVAALAAHLLTEAWVPPSRSILLAMLGAGFFLTLAHTFVFLAFRYASVPAVAPFGYCSTGWAVLAGILVFGDIPNALSIAGMGLIVVSGIAALLTEKRRASGPPPNTVLPDQATS